MSLFVSLLIGFGSSALIGLLAYQRGSLTRSGVVGAIVTGTAIFGFGGFVPGVLLVAFFVSSSLLSKYKARAKEKFSEKFQKGSRRDLGQALANGGWAALLAIGGWFAAQNASTMELARWLNLALLGALATVTADTWATEIGVLSKSSPRMITTGRVVSAGTSGGITWLGTAMAFCGGAFIGAMMIVANFLLFAATDFARALSEGVGVALMASASGIFFVLLAGVSGLLGSLFDSLLGATAQGIYFSEYDERQTEKKFDSQGNPTRLVRGWRWLDNDLVNFFASIFGSLVAAGAAFFIL